jgi:hypothetical protein
MIILFSLFNFLPAQATNVIRSISIEKSALGLGETLNFSVEVSCSTGLINQLYVVIEDPIGMTYGLNARGITPGDPNNTATGGVFQIPFKITQEASPGTYRTKLISLTCRDSNQAVTWEGDLGKLSFNVNDAGLIPAITQPKLEVIEMLNPTDRNIGETISFRVVASSTGKIEQVHLTLCNKESGTQVSRSYLQTDAAISGPEYRKVERAFEFKVESDWPEGIWSVCRVDISGRAGIDLSLPSGTDLNSINSTALSNRAVSILNLPGQSSFGWPTTGQVEQADISKITVNVKNTSKIVMLPPEATNLTLMATQIRAGEKIQLKVDLDGKGTNILGVWGLWVDSQTFNTNLANCFIEDLQSNDFAIKPLMTSATLTCKTSRSAAPGSYVLRQLGIQTTTCSRDEINSGANKQDCYQNLKRRATTYNNAYRLQSVESFPEVKDSLSNPLAKLPSLTVTEPGPAFRPLLNSVDAKDTSLTFKYQYDSDYKCRYSAPKGEVNFESPIQAGSVIVLGLAPLQELSLTGTCVANDGQSVTFTDKASTTLPKPPIIPLPTNIKKTFTSVKVSFSTLTIGGYLYEISSSRGSVSQIGDSVQVSGLKPGEIISLMMKVSDEFGQTVEGIFPNISTLNPPRLNPPLVSAISTGKNGYLFTFNKQSTLKYNISGTNCRGSISNNLIKIAQKYIGKKSTCYLEVRDSYNQKASVKFYSIS